MKEQWKPFLLIIILVFGMNTFVQADTISSNLVTVQSNGTSVKYDYEEVTLEEENGKTKVCICRALCFRALQMLATRFTDGVIPRDDIRITTGWTTDGPEELFVEVMGWSHEDVTFMASPTDALYLTASDAVFYFVQKSTGKVWKVAASADLYPIEFFTYRTLVQTEQATSEQKSFFQNALRPQAVANMAAVPLVDKLDIFAASIFGTDNILRIPVCFVSGGYEFEVQLKYLENGQFELVDGNSARSSLKNSLFK